eukprot:GHVT01061835.1.p1 GENE.GHVT01061835.1~~GHVT01061835.1.p1  ORF type:complete len:513 (+),score=101.18 GHVT01061835.1:355-1893(+)
MTEVVPSSLGGLPPVSVDGSSDFMGVSRDDLSSSSSTSILEEKSIQMYLDKHQLPDYFQELAVKLAADLPSNPVQYLIHLLDGANPSPATPFIVITSGLVQAPPHLFDAVTTIAQRLQVPVIDVQQYRHQLQSDLTNQDAEAAHGSCIASWVFAQVTEHKAGGCVLWGFPATAAETGELRRWRGLSPSKVIAIHPKAGALWPAAVRQASRCLGIDPATQETRLCKENEEAEQGEQDREARRVESRHGVHHDDESHAACVARSVDAKAKLLITRWARHLEGAVDAFQGGCFEVYEEFPRCHQDAPDATAEGDHHPGNHGAGGDAHTQESVDLVAELPALDLEEQLHLRLSFNPNSLVPFLPLRLALVSTVPSSPLCDRLARLAATLYGLVPVTPEDLQQANPHAAINSEDSATALLKVLGSTACRARGFCLVGFPVLAAHVSLLRRIRKLPTRVVVLVQAQEVDKNKFTRVSFIRKQNKSNALKFSNANINLLVWKTPTNTIYPFYIATNAYF